MLTSISIVPKLNNHIRFLMTKANPIVAVVLAGSGVYDGSEIHEASAVMVGLTRNNAEYKIFAPDINQMHVVDHTNGTEMKETRNVFVESARIARGAIEKLNQLNVADCDAVIFPGGFGAAKNLCNFAVKQEECILNEQVEKVIKDFHAAKKPIGLCCISPVLVAKAIPGCEITMGMDSEQEGKYPYAGSIVSAVAMGAKHFNKNVNEVVVDEANRIVTTPAYMCNTKVHEIHDGVSELVKAVLKLL